jgi:hypothetical protein
MEKVIVSYSIESDGKLKARLLAYGMGKIMSLFISDLIDESWRRQVKKLKVDREPTGYRNNIKRLVKAFIVD